MSAQLDEMVLTDPTSQPYQYRIFVNNCNDYIGSQVVETLRNDHLIEVNPNIIVGSLNQRDPSEAPADIQLVEVTHLPFSSATRPHTTRLSTQPTSSFSI
jgi:hypothetical protein